jgi:gliding motility-associated-like protein
VASDSIRINVVDPATLVCDTLYLPKAFTPNGDGINDQFGISNPFAIQQLVSFEIFDRWEGRVFYTEDPFGQWDGTYKGKPVNPGVLLYKIRHMCNGTERFASGSLTLLR